MAACQNLDSLRLVIQPELDKHEEHQSPDSSDQILKWKHLPCLPPLKELDLSVYLAFSQSNEEACLGMLAGFQCSGLRKLALTGKRLVEVLLPRYGDYLVSLQSLCISIFNFPENGRWNASEQTLLAVSKFLATKSLVELELDGISDGLPISLVASQNMKKLRLHMWEMDGVSAQAYLRSAKDIRELAEMAPSLEHLMLDIAHVGKLWYPAPNQDRALAPS